MSIATARIIDIHAHVRLAATNGAAGPHGPEFGTDEKGVVWYRVGNYRINGVKHLNSPMTDVNLRLKRMEESHIDFQVLSPSPLTYFHFIDAPSAISFCRAHNDACAELVREHPGKIGGLASLPMQSPEAAAEELHRAVAELGLWGAAVGSDFPLALDDPRFDRLYETCVKLNVPLCIHPAPAGIDGPPGDPNLKRFDLDVIAGFAAQETIALATLIFGGVMERHPKLDVWISHGGGTIMFLTGRLAQSAMLRPWAPGFLKHDGAFEEFLTRFWYDAHLNDPRALDLMIARVGNSKITYGTNFAGWDAPQPGQGHHHPVDPAWAGNARRLLRQDTTP